MRQRWIAVFLAAGVVLGILGYRAMVDHGRHPPEEALAHIAVAWTFLAAGLVAWSRRPESRIGALLTAAGFALLVRRLQYSESSAVFTTAYALGELSNVFIAHAVLAYPTGRLQSRLEGIMVRIGYVLVVAFPLATLFFYDPRETELFFPGFGGPPDSVFLVHASDHIVHLLRVGYRVTVFGVLGAVFIALIVRRFLISTPPRRRTLAPLFIAGAAAGIRALLEAALSFDTYPAAESALFWWQIAVQIAIPIALLAGILRARLARAGVGQLLLELERAPRARCERHSRGRWATPRSRSPSGSRSGRATSTLPGSLLRFRPTRGG